jgi:hypothetical protein
MKRTMPYGFAVLGVVVAGMMLLALSQAAAQEAAGELKAPARQARTADADTVPDIPVLVDPPESASEHAAGLTSPPERSRTSDQQRTIAMLSRHETALDIRMFGTGPDGRESFICKGGIVIVSKSLKFGTIQIEAEEAEISRGPKPKVDEPDENRDAQTLRIDNDCPMKVRFSGSVVVRQDRTKTPGQLGEWTIRAPEVEYDCVADRLIATDAKMELIASGLRSPVKIAAARIKIFHPLEQQPDGSLAPSEQRELLLEATKSVTLD